MYLIKKSSDNKGASKDSLTGSLPELKIIDDLTYKTIVFGFMWLTAGIITGAVWANEAWGTYWSWDPKETWSIITWFVYASTLHARFTRGWSGSRIAWLAIIGFVSVFFTYFGVNFLLSGLHSYGSS
jgi:cytochrome c-type biogenesis protein CcsB